MADYDIDLQYHPDKVNIILDTLTRRPMTMYLTQQKDLAEDMMSLGLKVIMPGTSNQFVVLQIQSSLNGKAKTAHAGDSQFQKIQKQV